MFKSSQLHEDNDDYGSTGLFWTSNRSNRRNYMMMMIITTGLFWTSKHSNHQNDTMNIKIIMTMGSFKS